MREPAVRVTWFLILTAVSTGAISYLNALGSFGKAGSLAMMWCPASAALGASFVTRRSLKEMGWRPQPKWMAIGWLIPISSAFIAYGGVWLAGLGPVPNPTFLSRARLTLNMAQSPDWLLIVAAFGFISVCLLPPSMISALGEELGWRGFLVPELTKWIGPQRAALASGVIWCAWHLPALLWFGYGVTGTPKIYQIACFSLLVVASAVVMAWLRIRSGSIWPAVVMHAVHNAAIQMFFDRITANTAHTAYFTGEFGIALVIPQAALAIYCIRKLRTCERSESELPMDRAASALSVTAQT